ncbi:glycoside hydrolase family 27 protein [Labilibaculum euxinus]
MRKLFLLLIMIVFSICVNAQKAENLALTPPMGWNSWNTFGTDINEQLVMQTADAFVELGLKEAGYEYIVLDDGWMAKERDENNNLVPDPKKFPGGIKSIVDYVHSKGLKFGLYECAGNQTCAGYPGSRGFEYQDAKLFAEWGIDFLKYDWCNTENLNAKGAYETMRDALHASKQPIVFSICEWGDNEPWKWAKDIGHLWRVTGDITNCWDCEVGHGNWSSRGIWPIINLRKDLRKFAGPGHWNDLDMMEVGNGMTDSEDRVHFAMWSLLTSPLILGNDLRSMSNETLKTIENKNVIAVNQDVLGIQAYCHLKSPELEIWVKPLANEEWAVAFINMSNDELLLSYDWWKHPINDQLTHKQLEKKYKSYSMYDLYASKNIGLTNKNLESKIKGHDVLLLKLSPQK